MSSRLSLVALLAVMFLPGCNNTLNPLCGSARPAPLINSFLPQHGEFSSCGAGRYAHGEW